MIFKNIKLTIFLLFIVGGAFAQQEQDEVILNTGDKIKGKIIAQKPGEYVKIVRYNITDTIIVKMEDIQLMQKISVPNEKPAPSVEPYIVDTKPLEVKSFNSRKYTLQFASLLGTGSGDFTEDFYFIELGLGVNRNVTSLLQMGIQFSLMVFESSNFSDFSYLPVTTLSGRYKFEQVAKNRVAYTVFGSVASLNSEKFKGTFKSLIDKNEYQGGGGISLKTGLGIQVNFLKNTGIMLDLGYMYQNVSLVSTKTEVPNSRGNRNGFFTQFSIFF